MFITEANPDHIAKLWQRVRAMFARATDIIGAIETLATFTYLTPTRRRDVIGPIALLEAVVRKLIFIEAAAIRRAELDARARLPRLETIPLTPPSWSARFQARIPPSTLKRAGSPRSNLQTFDPTQPETWRLRFKLAPPRDPRACPERLAPRIRDVWGPDPPPAPPPPPRAPHEVTLEPQRLALRFEALRRVIADPAPHARRLARLLPRLHRRFPEAPLRYAIACARPYWLCREDWRLINEAMTVAMIVAPLFANTS